MVKRNITEHHRKRLRWVRRQQQLDDACQQLIADYDMRQWHDNKAENADLSTHKETRCKLRTSE